MLKRRIIPCLDVARDRVVKGTQFVSLREQGDPADLALAYEEQGADEIVYLDISASSEGRGPDPHVVERVARRLSVPLTVGGGLGDVGRIGEVLAAGADKVSLNTPALRRPELVAEAAQRFGSQAVVAAVDVRRTPVGYKVFARGGREETPWLLAAWLQSLAARGAGEILLTSIDCDGTGQGYDLAALREAGRQVRLPLIASGGASTPDHLREALRLPQVTGALLAGALHTGRLTIAAIRRELLAAGVDVRAAV
jgi:cyclase